MYVKFLLHIFLSNNNDFIKIVTMTRIFHFMNMHMHIDTNNLIIYH